MVVREFHVFLSTRRKEERKEERKGRREGGRERGTIHTILNAFTYLIYPSQEYI